MRSCRRKHVCQEALLRRRHVERELLQAINERLKRYLTVNYRATSGLEVQLADHVLDQCTQQVVPRFEVVDQPGLGHTGGCSSSFYGQVLNAVFGNQVCSSAQ
ncbi:hypothetical protein SAMN04489710_1046 [Paracidovorax konjaci]|uniref:Uncharacterized protein n=1 Tax=Paracidovorax konjaci TaxID=32040 RepID=A0A1I1U0F7_9BURK|nr:hypothetical protein SAMN04489710_1046 [Paracidovorax konjaci]